MTRTTAKTGKRKNCRRQLNGLPRAVFASSLKDIITASTASNQSSSPNKSLSFQFSDGAVEALRLCHAEFISFIASSLALQKSSNKAIGTYIKDDSVKECMHDLGFQSILNRVLLNLETVESFNRKIQASKTRKSFTSSSGEDNGQSRTSKQKSKKATAAAMLEEQEKLLAASAIAHAKKNGRTFVQKQETTMNINATPINTNFSCSSDNKSRKNNESNVNQKVEENIQLSWKDGIDDSADTDFNLENYLME